MKKTILVVEDLPPNYLYLSRILQKLDFSVIFAHNGLEAVKTCKYRKEIDLVFMDLQLPIMDGFEATEKIKEICPELPIIAITAYTEEFSKEQALQSGCSNYIKKPYLRKDIVRVLNDYF